MSDQPCRRDFFKGAATVASGLVLTTRGARGSVSMEPPEPPRDQGAPAKQTEPNGKESTQTTGAPDRVFRISLAQWSLHRALFSGKMDALDFARTAARDYDIHAVEYVNQFFKDKARDRAYLTEMKKRADDAGVRSLLIMIDGEGRLGAPDPAERTRAVEQHYPWVKAAGLLGCHSIRVNAASAGSYEEQQKLAADGLRRLADFAFERGLGVIVENHGGLSSNGAWLAGTIKRVNRRNCGTLPDFGNFNLGGGKQYDRYDGVREMMPYAQAVSAKSYDFDPRGEETTIDYRRMLRIVVAAGYHGHVGIEYEGNRLSEPDGIRATRRLLETVRRELAKEGA